MNQAEPKPPLSAKPSRGNGAAVFHAEPTPAERRTTAAAVFADMARLREDEAAPLVSTEEVLVNVAVRRPKSGEFFRVHPSEEMQMTLGVYDDRDEQAVYYVLPELRPLLGEQVRQALLVTCVNQAGVLFLWPIKLASDGGGSRGWADSAIRAATLGKTKWVRVIGELKNQAYRVFAALGELPEPTWPARSLQELLTLAFEGRIVDHPEHAVVRHLQGR